MKSKIITIVVAIVLVAGVGTTVGVVVNNQNDKETASMIDAAVSDAVSQALETVTTTTIETTTTTTTTESTTESTTTTTTAKRKPSSSSKSTTKKKVKKTTTTQNNAIVTITNGECHVANTESTESTETTRPQVIHETKPSAPNDDE